MSVLNETKEKMKASIAHFVAELKGLRSNRANPALLDGVMVEVYGSTMRLRDMATITSPEPRQLLITPFDPQTAGPISKAIEKANLGVKPIIDGKTVRISIPPMDEAMRKEIVKVAKKKAEDAKVAIREVRRKGNETARKQKADGDLPEDALKKLEQQIQDLTDENCKQIDTLFSEKEKEILTV